MRYLYAPVPCRDVAVHWRQSLCVPLLPSAEPSLSSGVSPHSRALDTPTLTEARLTFGNNWGRPMLNMGENVLPRSNHVPCVSPLRCTLAEIWGSVVE